MRSITSWFQIILCKKDFSVLRCTKHFSHFFISSHKSFSFYSLPCILFIAGYLIHRRVSYSSFLYSSIFSIFSLSGPSLRTGKKKSSCLVIPKFFWMTKKTGTEKLPCLVTPKFFWTENSKESVQYENLN